MVWEESIILAPKTARFAFLSATIPNSREFADWVAKTHGSPCHVVYTGARRLRAVIFLSIFLSFFLYTGARRRHVPIAMCRSTCRRRHVAIDVPSDKNGSVVEAARPLLRAN